MYRMIPWMYCECRNIIVKSCSLGWLNSITLIEFNQGASVTDKIITQILDDCLTQFAFNEYLSSSERACQKLCIWLNRLSCKKLGCDEALVGLIILVSMVPTCWWKNELSDIDDLNLLLTMATLNLLFPLEAIISTLRQKNESIVILIVVKHLRSAYCSRQNIDFTNTFDTHNLQKNYMKNYLSTLPRIFSCQICQGAHSTQTKPTG